MGRYPLAARFDLTRREERTARRKIVQLFMPANYFGEGDAIVNREEERKYRGDVSYGVWRSGRESRPRGLRPGDRMLLRPRRHRQRHLARASTPAADAGANDARVCVPVRPPQIQFRDPALRMNGAREEFVRTAVQLAR